MHNKLNNLRKTGTHLHTTNASTRREGSLYRCSLSLRRRPAAAAHAARDARDQPRPSTTARPCGGGVAPGRSSPRAGGGGRSAPPRRRPAAAGRRRRAARPASAATAPRARRAAPRAAADAQAAAAAQAGRALQRDRGEAGGGGGARRATRRARRRPPGPRTSRSARRARRTGCAGRLADRRVERTAAPEAGWPRAGGGRQPHRHRGRPRRAVRARLRRDRRRRIRRRRVLGWRGQRCCRRRALEPLVLGQRDLRELVDEAACRRRPEPLQAERPAAARKSGGPAASGGVPGIFWATQDARDRSANFMHHARDDTRVAAFARCAD